MGLEDVPDFVDRLTALVGDVRTIASLDEVNASEWDVLITDAPWFTVQGSVGMESRTIRGLHDGVCVLYRAIEAATGLTVEDRADWAGSVEHSRGVVGDELLLPDTVPEPIAELVRTRLLPIALERRSHVAFRARRGFGEIKGPGYRPPRVQAPEFDPFLMTRDGAALAGRYQRSATAEAWLLPPDVGDLIPWVAAAVSEWHALNPSRFPALPNWADEAAWMTSRERKAAAALSKVLDRRRALLAEMEAEEAVARAARAIARDQADQGERRLLTADGDNLVDAVRAGLQRLGFIVDDRDQARPDEKLEDLLVTDPDVADWVALVEVKGFGRGAKTSGITQFLRFERRYTHENGH